MFVYKKNPRWTMFLEDDQLFVAKGADEIYLIEELSPDDAKKLYQAYKSDEVHILKSTSTNEKILKAIQSLEKSGVIYIKDDIYDSLKSVSFSIKWFDKVNDKILNILKQFIGTSNKLNLTTKTNFNDADLLIIIRTSGKLQEVFKDYEKIKIPHLFVDITYDHFISLGPFVFPEKTACLSCFIGRITYNWGDPETPPSPNIGESSELIASLILEQIRVFQKFGSCPELIEKVWSFNINELTTKIDNVFRLTWCPICYPPKPKEEGLGSFELPWRL